MQITQIKRKGKSETYHIYVDDEYYALVEAEIIYKFKLKVGNNYTNDILKQAKLESDKLLCSIKALNYVGKMLRTKKQVRDYLKKQNFEKEAIDLAINKLNDYGYINDSYYATMSAESMCKTKGKRYIKNDLLNKGVSEENVDQILEALDEEKESEACCNVTQKWLRGKVLPLDEKNKQKLYRFLLARGFDYNAIKNSLKNIQEFDE